MSAPVKVLLFSTLYPSSSRPQHGIFVETRLRKLLEFGGVEARVVAPVPWFPSSNARFGDYAEMAATPRFEARHGIEVWHPRYVHVPKVGVRLQPFTLAAAAAPAISKLRRTGFDFDVIDAHYFYPDGVAAALLGRLFARPFTITARGSDLNLIGQFATRRRMMQWAAHRAAASIGVCNALVQQLRGWGVRESQLHVMRNGVDLQLFKPLAQEEVRMQLGISGAPLLLSVGNLVPLKGHHLVIEAVAQLKTLMPGVRLVIVGDGPERNALEDLARSLSVTDRVRFAGRVPQQALAQWYSAADMLVLASSREGWANVLLESMACGTPVLATNVGGSPEVVETADVGSLLKERSAQAIAEGVREQWSCGIDRVHVRRYAEMFSWDATSQAQRELFTSLKMEPASTEVQHA